MRFQAFFCLFAFFTVISPSSGAEVEGTASQKRLAKLTARTRSANDEVLRIRGELQQADFKGNAALRSDAATAIHERAMVLSDLIEADPTSALKFSFSPELAAELAAQFPEAAGELETHGTWEGPVEAWIMEYPDGSSRTVRQMKIGGEPTEVHFAGSEPAGWKTGSVLQATGVKFSNRIVASSSSVQTTTAAATGSVTAAAGCTTTGAQNTAALLVNFPGTTPPSNVTAQTVGDILFGTTGQSMDGFWREASHGQTFATGDVFGWYPLSASYTCDQLSSLFNDALTQASKSGVNFQNYSRIFIVTPSFGCGWSGIASIGCSAGTAPNGSIYASTSYLNADFLSTQSHDASVQLAAHEGGHNLGLDHAHSLAFSGEPLGPLGATGTAGEYGDMFSDMSNQFTAHYATYHKALLNWMVPGTNYAVVQNSGTWSIQPAEASPTGLQALKVQRGTGNNAWLWIEYRQPIGIYDSSFSSMSQPYTGAVIHYDDGTGSLASSLLAFGSPSNGFYTPALAAGQTWTDPYTNLSITVQSATSTALTVSVNYGSTPCTHANPNVSISPANPSVSAGSTVNYTLAVTNNDSSGCAASTFALASTQPSGWAGTYSPGSLTLNPGQTASVTLTEAVPTTAPAATYALTGSAANGSYSGSASANCTVVAGGSLTDTLSLTSSTYSPRQTVPTAARVLSGGAAASGASVVFTMTKPNGSMATAKITADSTGTATWSYKVGPKDPSGTYSVQSKATYQTTTATSNTVTFTVQ